jgi:hypothetical protein
MVEMPPEEAIFHAALALDAADRRAAFLDVACVGRAELRRRVEDLLTFLEKLEKMRSGLG